MKYLNLFDNHNAYEDYVDGGLMSYPNVSYCIEEDELHYMKESPIIPYENQYLTFEVVEAGTITIKQSNSSAPTVTIQYSTDNGQNWTSLTTSTTEQSFGNFNVGDKLMIKGNNTHYAASDNYNCFSGTAKTNVYGNIMSLIYGDNFTEQTVLTTTYTFYGLFKRYTNLLSAENLILPATTLAQYCYSDMFNGCTSLTTAPELPATTLASTCYYSMFHGCTSLTTAPELPATTLASTCYSDMFNGCTSLTTAPELPATTLDRYCYKQMFYDCTSLNYIKCLATNKSASNCIYWWVYNVAATGTFVKDANTTWSTGISGIPSGWTVQDA